ncbi:MAG TPA: cytochrome [Candidatus Binatia bacterium]|nr:cytochrome [Candidatus Binatia bacterium]
MALPAIDPMPPRAPGRLPWIGSGTRLLRNPTRFFAGVRARLGDTYVADAFGRRLFCVFSPAGVRALYALREDEASFGRATYDLLTLKLPPELFAGRRVTPHRLFAGDDVTRYLRNLEGAVAAAIDELGTAGTCEVFATMRRLGHRLGLASWLGTEAASPPWIDRLVPLFDRLDSADTLVRPAAAFRTIATRWAAERRVLRALQEPIGALSDARRAGAESRGDVLDQIHAAYADVPEPDRRIGIARDVVMLQLGSQSNLHAALAWTFVQVVTRPSLVAAVRAGDADLVERCASESIRLAQRSITLRAVLRPLALAIEDRTYRLAPGVLIATMLSVTNTTAAPGLDGFDPAHFDGRRLAADVPLPTRELVSTFGHGLHACPAQRFAITAIRIAVERLVARYEIVPRFTTAAPAARQLGAVGRAERPCVITYRARD